MTTPELRAQLRDSVLDKLCRRPAVAIPADSLHVLVGRARDVEGEVGRADLLDALAFLEGYGFVRRVRRPLSGLQDWQATSEGVAFWEEHHG
jgi:predicted deacylase